MPPISTLTQLNGIDRIIQYIRAIHKRETFTHSLSVLITFSMITLLSDIIAHMFVE